MMNKPSPQQIKKQIASHFARASQHYAQHAVVQKKTADLLFDNLSYLNIQPNIMMDLGCGIGIHCHTLHKLYPQAQLLALDLSLPSLLQAQKKQRWLSKRYMSFICADMDHLPCPAGSIDMIFSNLTLQWSLDLSTTLQALYRVLKPQGLLLFSTLGPNTFQELRNAWEIVNTQDNMPAPVNPFIDMHDIGDLLVKTGFAEPVVGMNNIQLTYPNARDILHDIRKIGATTVLNNHQQGLMGKKRMQRFLDALNKENTLTYEIITITAWRGHQHGNAQLFSIDPSSIKKRGKNND